MFLFLYILRAGDTGVKRFLNVHVKIMAMNGRRINTLSRHVVVNPTSVIDQVMENINKAKPSRSLLKTHVRLIVATYELHNYCRINNRPIRSGESGAKMVRRMMKDVYIGGKEERKRRRADKKALLALACL